MIINHLLKYSILIIFIFHYTFAKEYKGNCKEIKTIIDKVEYNELTDCVNDNNGNVVSLDIYYNKEIETDDIKKILSYNTLTKFTLTYERSYYYSDKHDGFKLILNLISNLTNLEELHIIYSVYDESQTSYYNKFFTIDKNILKNYKNLKKLGLKFFQISQDNIDELSTLKNFKELELDTCILEDLNFESFENIEILSVTDGKIYNNMKTSEYTNFDKEYIKQFKNLKKLILNGEPYDLTSTTTKTTTTTKKSSATSTNGRCGKDYGHCPSGQCCSKYNHCGTSDDHCLASKGCQSEFGKCTSTSTTTKTTTTTKKSSATSTNGRCGKDYGHCPSGQCCSKYNHCGTSDDHCLASKGCQSEFGKCTSTSTTTKKTTTTTKKSSATSTNGRCGKDYGHCPSGQCCSKYNHCGTSDDHCLASKGCQSEFGKCTSTSTTTKTTTTTKKSSATSTNGRCGKDYGHCPSGQCCSKYNHCGTSDDHCLASKGCQSEFGKCTSTSTTTKTTTTTKKSSATSTNGRCGKDYGHCPSGQCCSKYNHCGTSDDHCLASKGCQSEFGKCTSTSTTTKKTTTTTKKSSATSTNGRCGKDYGHCPSGQCCSKYNHCGTSDDHCLASKGCQSEFGKCTSTSTTTKTTTTTKKSSATSTNGRCGKDYGKCPSGQCCSKYNHCGTSDDHCLASKGCQSEFGKCK